MIPIDAITHWRAYAPWVSDPQIEQDLIISRALVEIYQTPSLAERLAFRGGTALHKLYLQPAARYSEDLDFVQRQAQPIGETLDTLRAVLDPWLGNPRREMSTGLVKLTYRFNTQTTPSVRRNLKIEINSREHFSTLGIASMSFSVQSPWFRGECDVATFHLAELLGTKLRALYQRRKGRDLFDLWLALTTSEVDPSHIITCFQHYMSANDETVSRTEFEENLNDKMAHPTFLADMGPLLRADLAWNMADAHTLVTERLLSLLP